MMKTTKPPGSKARLKSKPIKRPGAVSTSSAPAPQTTRAADAALSSGPAPSGGICLELVRPEAKSVFVAGTFNEWQPAKTPLKAASGGKWTGALCAQPGRHEYLFVVDGQWLPDPNAKEAVQNPYGGMNSVITIPA